MIRSPGQSEQRNQPYRVQVKREASLPLPRKHAQSTALLHSLQVLLRILHILVDLVHALIDAVQLLYTHHRTHTGHLHANTHKTHICYCLTNVMVFLNIATPMCYKHYFF